MLFVFNFYIFDKLVVTDTADIRVAVSNASS